MVRNKLIALGIVGMTVVGTASANTVVVKAETREATSAVSESTGTMRSMTRGEFFLKTINKLDDQLKALSVRLDDEELYNEAMTTKSRIIDFAGKMRRKGELTPELEKKYEEAKQKIRELYKQKDALNNLKKETTSLVNKIEQDISSKEYNKAKEQIKVVQIKIDELNKISINSNELKDKFEKLKKELEKVTKPKEKKVEKMKDKEEVTPVKPVQPVQPVVKPVEPKPVVKPVVDELAETGDIMIDIVKRHIKGLIKAIAEDNYESAEFYVKRVNFELKQVKGMISEGAVNKFNEALKEFDKLEAKHKKAEAIKQQIKYAFQDIGRSLRNKEYEYIPNDLKSASGYMDDLSKLYPLEKEMLDKYDNLKYRYDNRNAYDEIEKMHKEISNDFKDLGKEMEKNNAEGALSLIKRLEGKIGQLGELTKISREKEHDINLWKIRNLFETCSKNVEELVKPSKLKGEIKSTLDKMEELIRVKDFNNIPDAMNLVSSKIKELEKFEPVDKVTTDKLKELKDKYDKREKVTSVKPVVKPVDPVKPVVKPVVDELAETGDIMIDIVKRHIKGLIKAIAEDNYKSAEFYVKRVKFELKQVEGMMPEGAVKKFNEALKDFDKLEAKHKKIESIKQQVKYAFQDVRHDLGTKNYDNVSNRLAYASKQIDELSKLNATDKEISDKYNELKYAYDHKNTYDEIERMQKTILNDFKDLGKEMKNNNVVSSSSLIKHIEDEIGQLTKLTKVSREQDHKIDLWKIENLFKACSRNVEELVKSNRLKSEIKNELAKMEELIRVKDFSNIPDVMNLVSSKIDELEKLEPVDKVTTDKLKELKDKYDKREKAVTVKPIKPVVQPGVNPVELVKPVQPVVKPVNPVRPVQPAVKPVDPVRPVQPVVQPVKPVIKPEKSKEVKTLEKVGNINLNSKVNAKKEEVKVDNKVVENKKNNEQVIKNNAVEKTNTVKKNTTINKVVSNNDDKEKVNEKQNKLPKTGSPIGAQGLFGLGAAISALGAMTLRRFKK